MLRNVFIVLVLAALAATSATASPVVSAKTHRHASSPAARHKTIRHTGVSTAPRNRGAASAPRGHSFSSAGRTPAHLARIRGPHAGTVSPKLVSLQRSRFVMPSPLKGSLESLERQNERAEAEGLERILDEDDLSNRIAQKLLVPVPASSGLLVNGNLPENHRYCRPWTADFLRDLARAHAAQFHKPIGVSSAVRTVEYQQQLMHINGNAAPAEGDIVSPHLTGATIDIVKQGMSRQELGWMRGWLLALQVAGTIDVEEEFRQKCFHITVYRNYLPPPTAPTLTAGRRRHAVSANQLATRGK